MEFSAWFGEVEALFQIHAGELASLQRHEPVVANQIPVFVFRLL